MSSCFTAMADCFKDYMIAVTQDTLLVPTRGTLNGRITSEHHAPPNHTAHMKPHSAELRWSNRLHMLI